MTEHLEQGTDEWLQARCGLVTASRISDVVSRTKSGWGASRATYMGELIAERLTGTPAKSFTNAAMQWGNDTEPQARAWYSFTKDVIVDEVGLVQHPSIAGTAASPDGTIGEDGLIEIKCPNTATHIDYMLKDKIPAKYLTQMQWQMACTGRQWCDFLCFDPRMPEHLSAYLVRVQRDDERIDELEGLVSDFITEMEQKISDLENIEKENS